MKQNILARLKYYVFKKMYDEDLYTIFKLSRSIGLHRLHKIKIKNLRHTAIATRFANISDYIESMNALLAHIRKREIIEKNDSYVINTSNVYLDDWLIMADDSHFSAYMAHKLIQKKIINIIDEIYNYHNCDMEYFSYYKRCSMLHFQQLKEWIITIKNILED